MMQSVAAQEAASSRWKSERVYPFLFQVFSEKEDELRNDEEKLS